MTAAELSAAALGQLNDAIAAGRIPARPSPITIATVADLIAAGTEQRLATTGRVDERGAAW
jgi:hypothetical protein